MSDYFNNKVILKDNELDLVMTALELTIKSFEKVMGERGHNNMSVSDQFTYVDVKKLYEKLKEQYY